MKKWFVVFVIVAFSFKTYAKSGICGESYEACHYDLTDDGILTISGNGAMNDYDITLGDNSMPWGNKIKEVQMSGITSIGSYAFYNTPSLTDVVIPKTVENINEGAFAMTSLKDVVYETDEEGRTKLASIGRDVFAMTNLTNMVIPDSVTDVGRGIFYRDKKLESIVIPDSVTSLGIYALAEASQNAVIYCHDTAQRSCSDLVSENNGNDIGKLVQYFIDGNGFYQTEDGRIFANADLMANGVSCDNTKQCEALLASAQSGTFSFNGKFYNSLGDLAHHNYIKKRIYTIDEANRVAGSTNRVSIKYR